MTQTNNSTLIKALLVFGLALAIPLLLNSGCGNSSSNSITSNNQALSEIPNSDPSAMDYSISSGGLSVRRSLEETDFRSALNITILAKISHTKGAGLGTFSIQQCVNGGSQSGYASYTVENDTYTGTVYYRESGGSNDMDILSTVKAKDITDDGFSGDVDINFGGTARLITSASGSTEINTLKGTKDSTALYCAWDSNDGCAIISGNSAVGFNISVNSSTKAKTYSASSDVSKCSSPSYTTVRSVATLSSAQTWNCSLPSGAAWIDVSKTAPEVEDAGGSQCKSASDSWENSSTDPSACSATTTAAGIGCLCDSLQSLAIQKVRRAMRQFTCKVKGIFKMVKSGALTSIDMNDGDKTIYLRLSL